MTSTIHDTPVEAPVPDQVEKPPASYPAGVLAHGLHAIAHHIGLYRLDYIRTESYPGAVDGRPVVEVVVDRHDIEGWLESVHIDAEHRDDQDHSSLVRRYVRLPDSGVVVSLLTIEWHPAKDVQP